jgi:D-alanyl-D-alanine carboxypeptidase
MRSIYLTVAILFFAILFFQGVAWAQTNSAAFKTDTFISHQVHNLSIAGLSLAVVKNGKVVFSRGYGLANIETGTAADAGTVYKIGSVSKQFISAEVLLLKQDGKLDTHDKVSKYLDSIPGAWQEMTVYELLTHTAGLPLDPPGFEPYEQVTDSAITRQLYRTPLLFPPGDSLSYSNAGYFVLAEIVRKVSGMPWQDFVAGRIFRPLGMTDTRSTTVTDIVPHRANGYDHKNGRWSNAASWIAVRPSGAFLSTVPDMAKWDAALYGDKILSAAGKDEMLTPVRLNNGKTVPYGYGWSLPIWKGHRAVCHDGGMPGFSASILRLPDDGLTVIVLTNTGGIYAMGLAVGVADFYLPAVSSKK